MHLQLDRETDTGRTLRHGRVDLSVDDTLNAHGCQCPSQDATGKHDVLHSQLGRVLTGGATREAQPREV